MSRRVLRLSDTRGVVVRRFAGPRGVHLPQDVSLEDALQALREVWPSWPDCDSWAQLQRQCRAANVLLVPGPRKGGAQ